MAEFSIRATPNGPYIVQGITELLDTVSDKYPLDKRSGSRSASRHRNNSVREAAAPTFGLVC